MKRENYLELIEKHPDLTSPGHGIQSDPNLGSTYDEIFTRMRQELRDSYEAFLACVDWLDKHPDFEPGWSSYALKHEVENWLETLGRRCYIPQGAFILAVLERGLPMKCIPDDLGVFVG